MPLLRYERLHFEFYDFFEGRGGCLAATLYNKTKTILTKEG